MQTHNLQQGSSPWHEFRADHFGASEAAAMLGLSNDLTRNDLLLYKKTGKSKTYSEWVQKNILDYGHEVEISAMQITESTLDTELFPVTCSLGKLSASCDGLTDDHQTAWEHKQWNVGLVKYITDNGTVPDTHMPQCQQILLVTGAKALVFTVSDGTESKRISCEVTPNKEWFDRIESGWSQFEKDLELYEHKEFTDKPEAAAIMQLPALSIQIKGEVTVSNLPQFKAAADQFIASIRTDLQTDNDFVDAEATVKFCDETEKKLESAKAAAIGQTASIDELMRTIDFIKESIRTKRLTLEKLVKTQKESIKTKIINDGYQICVDHSILVNPEFPRVDFIAISHTVLTRNQFELVCKSKRTLASLHNAVDTEVAAIKIKLDDLARVIRKNITHLPDDLSLFRDLQSIITKPEDDFKLLVESRMTEQKRKEEEAAKREIEKVQAAAFAAQEKTRIEREDEDRAKAAVEEGKVRMRLAEEVKKEAETKRLAQEEAARITNEYHRKKIISETIESLIDLGFDEGHAENLVMLILEGEVKHVSIKF